MITGNIKDRVVMSAQQTAGAGGTSNYEELENLPSINNVELKGNKSGHDLGLANLSDIPIIPPTPVYRIIKTNLWENTETGNPNTIELNDSIYNYDFILFDVYRTSYNQYHMPAFIYSIEQLTQIIANNQSMFFMGWSSNNEFVCYKFTDDENLYKNEEGGYMKILNIYGIKLGAIV